MRRRVRKPHPVRAAIAEARAQSAARPALEQDLAGREFECARWRLIAAHLEAHPFDVPDSIPRSEQWRCAVQVVRDFDDVELLDWALQQAAIARNHERGIRDMRVASRGSPCFALTAYARQRERKACVVLDWMAAAVASGADLAHAPSRVFTSELRPAPKLGNPLERRGSLWEDD